MTVRTGYDYNEQAVVWRLTPQSGIYFSGDLVPADLPFLVLTVWYSVLVLWLLGRVSDVCQCHCSLCPASAI